MARTNFYIKDEVRERMREASHVNWSRVASAAIEAKLAELNREKEIAMTDQQVVDRIRASKNMQEDTDQKEGFDAGVQWAKLAAEWRHFERLSKINSADSPDDYPGDWLWETVIGPDEGSRPRRDDVEALFGEGIADPSHSFVEGFIEGALTVFENVKEQL